jgi:hypothetical protein
LRKSDRVVPFSCLPEREKSLRVLWRRASGSVLFLDSLEEKSAAGGGFFLLSSVVADLE